MVSNESWPDQEDKEIEEKTLTEDLFTFETNPYTPIIICTPLLLKSGAAPLHWWFPRVIEGLRWENRALLIFWHRSFTFNSNKSPTRCNNFSVYFPDVCLQLNMFRAFSRPSSGAKWLQWQPLVLHSYRGDSRAVFVVGPAGPTTNTVNKRQENKLKKCCIRLVIYLNCSMMHGLTNLKFYI